MGHRFWTRHFNATGGVGIPLQPNGLYHQDTMEGSSNVNATIVRWLLDVRFSIAFPATGSTGKPFDWWTELHVVAGAGVSTSASPVPHPDIMTTEDDRVTLTGMLIPTYVESTGTNAAHACTWSNVFPMDSKGMRKAPEAGFVPLADAMLGVVDPHNVTQTGSFLNPTITITSYFRVLWDDPT